MTEAWAQECAKYEEGGAAEYLKATLEYERRAARGWSGDVIAAEVTEAGFPIHGATVRRRLQALREVRGTVRARANSKEFLEAFAEAYAGLNASGRGRGTALDPETALRVYLEGVVGEFERHFSDHLPELDEEELANIRRLRDHCDAVLNGRPVLRLVENTA